MELRIYQQDAINQVYSAWNAGAQNVLLQLATGGGKTICFSKIIADHSGHSIAIAHRMELVSQISLTLARNGVWHNIIAQKAAIREIIAIHMSELKRSYYDPQARVCAAGVDTLLRLPADTAWFKRIGLVVIDECFPAGTLIEGKPIESIKIGDYVTAFNESTQRLEQRQVTRLFKNVMPPNMVSIYAGGHHVLNCTSGHPIYTTRGWINAGNLTESDYILRTLPNVDPKNYRDPTVQIQKNWAYLLYEKMRDAISRYSVKKTAMVDTSKENGRAMFYLRQVDFTFRALCIAVFKNTSRILQSCMFESLPRVYILSDNGKNKQAVCFRKNESAESYVSNRRAGENAKYYVDEKTSTNYQRWKRTTRHACGRFFNGNTKWIGLYSAACDFNIPSETGRISSLLQTGYRKLLSKISYRSRWSNPSRKTQGIRSEERYMLKWVRVDGIKVYQSSNNIRNGKNASGNYVYNFEVDGLHTYVANDTIVHNCHHVLAYNKWGKAAALFPQAKGLYPTATPVRADGHGLGRHADGIIDTMVTGIGMRELINIGYLCDYRIFAPPSDLDLSTVPISAGGDYNPPKLRTAVHRSHITGDVVSHYLRIAPGLQGVTFAVDVEAATEIAAAFRDAGVAAEVVSGKTPDLLRAHIISRFRRGELMQLVNVDLFGEGFDLPAISVVSMARPTQSFCLYSQSFGRALRPKPDGRPAIIIDHVGNVMRHGLPDAPRAWSLDRRDRRSKSADDVIPLRTCLNPRCMGVYPRTVRVCPNCGFYSPPASRSTPEQVDGDLFELDPEVLAQLRGEIDRIDGAVRIPQHLDHIAQRGVANQHAKRQRAQVALRDSIAQWAGWLHAKGVDDSGIYRQFYHTFGVDIATAQTLGVALAEGLQTRVIMAIDSMGNST